MLRTLQLPRVTVLPEIFWLEPCDTVSHRGSQWITAGHGGYRGSQWSPWVTVCRWLEAEIAQTTPQPRDDHPSLFATDAATDTSPNTDTPPETATFLFRCSPFRQGENWGGIITLPIDCGTALDLQRCTSSLSLGRVLINKWMTSTHPQETRVIIHTCPLQYTHFWYTTSTNTLFPSPKVVSVILQYLYFSMLKPYTINYCKICLLFVLLTTYNLFSFLSYAIYSWLLFVEYPMISVRIIILVIILFW